MQNSVEAANVKKIQTQHIQNSAQNTNLIKNRTEHIQNSARDTNVQNNYTEHIQNGAVALTWLQILKNTFKKVCKELTNQTIQQNT